MFYADGGPGDDIIKPYIDGDDEPIAHLIRGGKGNDKINVYEGSDLIDSDGVINLQVYTDNIADDWYASLLLDGGEGDDEIWHF